MLDSPQAPPPDETPTPGAIGAQLTVEVIRLVRQRHGRGPVNGRTILTPDGAVTVLRGLRTPQDDALRSGGFAELARERRVAVDQGLHDELRLIAQRILGRGPLAVLSSTDEALEVCAFVFLLQ